MRRKDREVKNFEDIINIISRCDTIHLGLNDSEYPYVVPLSFGFEVEGRTIIFYFHGAKEGLKHDLIAKNNKVCVEASIFHRFVEMPQHNAFTTEYESFIGFGIAEQLTGQPAVKGLDLICGHAGFNGTNFGGEQALGITGVYKITINSYSAKRRFL